MTRLSILIAALLLTACASAPGYVSPDDKAEARLRDLTVAEARLKKARTQIDLDEDAGEAELREYYAAREHLMRLRSEYGPTETEYDDLGWHPVEALGHGTVVVGGTMPTGINGEPVQ